MNLQIDVGTDPQTNELMCVPEELAWYIIHKETKQNGKMLNFSTFRMSNSRSRVDTKLLPVSGVALEGITLTPSLERCPRVMHA